MGYDPGPNQTNSTSEHKEDISEKLRWKKLLLSEHGPPSTQRLILLILAWHGNKNGESIYPKTETIVKESGFSIRTVQEAIRQAEKSGWLKRTHVRNRGMYGQFKTSKYKLTFPKHLTEDT